MKSVAGKIVGRFLGVILFLSGSAIVCCGITKGRATKEIVVFPTKIGDNCCTQKCAEEIRPNQLVSIRLMQLI